MRVAGFKAHDQQAATGVGHGLQRVVIAVDARRAGPLEADRLEFLAESDDAIFANIEGIVVEEKFLGLREHLVRLLEFARDALHRSRAPRVAGKRLRPQAESTQRRTSARRVEGNERMQQERDIVLLDRQVLLVHFGGKRQRVELFGLHQRPRRIVHHLAVFHVAGVADLRERLALRVFHDGMIEFAAHHEIEVGAGKQAFGRLDLHVRADKGDLDVGLLLFHRASHAQIAVESHGGREQHDELVILGGSNDLSRSDVVRRAIEQAAARQHASGIGEPNRIPVGLDLARGGPARAGASIEFLETRRVQGTAFSSRTASIHPLRSSNEIPVQQPHSIILYSISECTQG